MTIENSDYQTETYDLATKEDTSSMFSSKNFTEEEWVWQQIDD